MSHITRSLVQADRSSVFVFGDNMEGRGFGGQAAAMRGEPNTIGVPTKWRPERTSTAYFTDEDMRNGNVKHAIMGAFERIHRAMADGRNVVIPADGLGTGLADLPARAPRIHAYIEASIATLENANANAGLQAFNPPRWEPPITEADWAAWKKMMSQIRRCIRAGCKKGRPWNHAATVEEIATACRTTADEVVRLIRACGWLIAVNESEKPTEQWTVYEDGE